MRIGAMIGADPRRAGVDDLLAEARDLEARGFATAWVPHVLGVDAVTAAALVGRATSRIEVGTAVVPTYPRHPSALAQQALTAGAACEGRFTLGIGLSHPVVIERVLGLSMKRRAAHMREYLSVLGPLLRGEAASFAGEEYRVELGLALPSAPPVPLLLAALGEQMLRIAGRLAAGTILWMTGPRTVEEHIAPTIRAAAEQAGRPAPRIVVGTQIALTSDPEALLSKLERRMGLYSQLPSYRAMLEREGGASPLDLALVGDEKTLDAGLARLRGLGVSDFEAVVVAAEDGEKERTLDYLASHI